MKIRTEKVIEVRDWDNLVKDTYGKIYSFQQQYGCQERGRFEISVPNQNSEDEDYNEEIPEIVNGDEMGVKFDIWKNTPNSYPEHMSDFDRELFWERNYYPDVHTIANNLYEKGLLEKGDYSINIDW